MNNEIIKLTSIWYKVVNLDHHKDRDCHWYINTVYSYGKKPEYFVEHYGYIYKNVKEIFDTYEEAEQGLIDELKEAIETEKEWAENVLKKPKSWGLDQVETANKIIEINVKRNNT